MRKSPAIRLLLLSFVVTSCGAQNSTEEQGWRQVGSLDDLIHFVEADPLVMTSAAHYRRAVDMICQTQRCVQVAFFLPGDQLPPSGPRSEFFKRGGWRLYRPAAIFMGDEFTRWDCERLNFVDAPASALCSHGMSESAAMPSARAFAADSPENSIRLHRSEGGERRQILDALRPAVEAEMKVPVEFVVETFRVSNGWAFVVANPQRKGGEPLDGAAIFGDQFDNMDGLRVDAVLRRQNGGWTLVEKAIGATDVWYCDVGPRSLKQGHGC